MPSELKVSSSERGTRLTATDEAGQTVLEILRGSAAQPVDAVLTTAAGTWQLARRERKLTEVVDSAGAVYARIHRSFGRGSEIELPGGELIEVSTPVLKTGYSCKIGDLARAKAPWWRPNRYFTLTLSDELLARGDRELITAVGALLADSAISAQISAAASSPPV